MTQSSKRSALREQQAAAAKAARTRRIVGIGLGVVALILTVIVIVVFIRTPASAPGAASGAPRNATATNDGVTLYAGHAKPDAPRIDVYLDFQCPVCKTAESSYNATMKQLAEAGDIVLVQHTLTFMDGNLHNTASTRAATAATCADIDGTTYPAMTAAIYARQQTEELVGSVGYEDSLLRSTLPAEVGITGAALTTYQQCYDTAAPRAFLANVTKAGYAANVGGTPTFQRNGVELAVHPVAAPKLKIVATTPEQFASLLLTGH